MCCAFLTLVLLGPRFFGAMWWLIQPARWQAAFNGWTGGNLWWIWPILGIIFLPWTTIMFVIVAPGGVDGWDWVWLGLDAGGGHFLVRWWRRPQSGFPIIRDTELAARNTGKGAAWAAPFPVLAVCLRNHSTLADRCSRFRLALHWPA